MENPNTPQKLAYNIIKGENMALQQLKYVVTVAETGTITEATKQLFISQPSLTNAVHELEKEMDVVIFNRTNKGISTETGFSV